MSDTSYTLRFADVPQEEYPKLNAYIKADPRFNYGVPLAELLAAVWAIPWGRKELLEVQFDQCSWKPARSDSGDWQWERCVYARYDVDRPKPGLVDPRGHGLN